MPTDVKLNAEELPDSFLDQLCAECEWEYGEKVVGKQTLWRIVSELQARRALDNSKPTPAVGDNGLIARLNAACISNPYALIPWPHGLLHKAASALAAAHSQHEADVAMIGELTEALRPFAEYMKDGGDLDNKGNPLPDDEGPGWVYLTMADFRRARSVLAKVKP